MLIEGSHQQYLTTLLYDISGSSIASIFHFYILEYKWLHSSAYASIPKNAVVGGNDFDGDMIYVGRAFHNGDMLVAKVIPAKHIAFVSLRGEEIPKDHFEVLTSQRVAWQHCYDHVIPPNAVLCGNTSLGQPVYIGRGHYEGSLTIGKVSSVHRALFIPFKGVERRLTSYEILVVQSKYNPVPSTPPPPPPPFIEKPLILLDTKPVMLPPPPPPLMDKPIVPLDIKPVMLPPPPPNINPTPYPPMPQAPLEIKPPPPPPYPPTPLQPPPIGLKSLIEADIKPPSYLEPLGSSSVAFVPVPSPMEPPPPYDPMPMPMPPPMSMLKPSNAVSVQPAATYQPASYQPATYQSAAYEPAAYEPATYEPASTYQPNTYDIWAPASSSHTPPNAVHAGHDTDLSTIYVCRAFHEGNQIPGKALPNRGCAFISYAGYEIPKYDFEILVGSNYHWVHSSDGNVPPGAVEAGSTASGEPLFVGRAHYCGSLTPGKIQRSHNCLYIAYGGHERRITHYEVLVRRDDYYRGETMKMCY